MSLNFFETAKYTASGDPKLSENFQFKAVTIEAWTGSFEFTSPTLFCKIFTLKIWTWINFPTRQFNSVKICAFTSLIFSALAVTNFAHHHKPSTCLVHLYLLPLCHFRKDVLVLPSNGSYVLRFQTRCYLFDICFVATVECLLHGLQIVLIRFILIIGCQRKFKLKYYFMTAFNTA